MSGCVSAKIAPSEARANIRRSLLHAPHSSAFLPPRPPFCLLPHTFSVLLCASPLSLTPLWRRVDGTTCRLHAFSTFAPLSNLPFVMETPSPASHVNGPRPSSPSLPDPSLPSPSPPKTPLSASPAKPPVPMSRPSQPPKRKRRRSAPPPNVTSVFSPAHLPTAANNLWTWPVFTWFFGAVNQTDVRVASGNAFIDPSHYSHPAKLPPPATHYRLKWLEQDAEALVSDHPRARPPNPEPLPSLPNFRTKDSHACARPLPFVLPAEDEGVSAKRRRKRARASVSNKASAITPPPANSGVKLEQQPLPVEAKAKTEPQLQGAEQVPSAAHLVVDTCVPNETHLAQSNVPDAPPGEGRNSISDQPNNSGAVLSNNKASAGIEAKTPVTAKKEPRLPPSAPTPSPAVNTLAHATPLHTENPTNDTNGTSPKGEDGDIKMIDADSRSAEHKDPALKSDAHPRVSSVERGQQQVQLQFLSPAEKRLMGTITYSIPARQESSDDNEDKMDTDEVSSANPLIQGVTVEDMDLEFRKPENDFVANFADSDNVDELGPQLVHLSKTLSSVHEANNPIRSEALTAIQTELLSQRAYAEMAAEEKQIRERLKEIAEEKEVQKIATVTVTKTRSSARRRSSNSRPRRTALPRPSSRRQRVSRPTRKILEELDDEDDEQQTILAEQNKVLEVQTQAQASSNPKDNTDNPSQAASTAVPDPSKSAPAMNTTVASQPVVGADANESSSTIPYQSSSNASQSLQFIESDLPMMKMSPVTPCDSLPEENPTIFAVPSSVAPEPEQNTEPANGAATRDIPVDHPKDAVAPSESLDKSITAGPQAPVNLNPSNTSKAVQVPQLPQYPESSVECSAQAANAEQAVGLGTSTLSSHPKLVKEHLVLAPNALADPTIVSPHTKASTEMKTLTSPVGILPRENEQNMKMERVPSPVSPIQNATGSCIASPISLNLHLKPKSEPSSGMILSLRLNPKS